VAQVTDPHENPFLPPDLQLGDDDVIEAFEELEVAIEETTDVDPEPDDTFEVEPERVSGFDGVGTRRESRERALALLYEAETKGLTPIASVIDDLPVPPEAYAAELVVGVSDHLAELDDLIGRYSVGWTVARMPAIDRTLLRLATYELAHTDVPVGACISEAVELAKRYSTDDSHTFINGLLSRLAAELRSEHPDG
jgi:N utilization substance protein B